MFPAGTFAYQDLTKWVRAVPRLGLAWNLDSKSVVKTSFGLYNPNIGSSFGFAYNRDALSRTTFRWRDSDGNGDYTPGETNLTLNGGPDFSFTEAVSLSIDCADQELPYGRQIVDDVLDRTETAMPK